jgi:hypothetical protein
MSNRPTANQIDHYFIHVRLLPSGSLKKIEIPAAKALFQRQFPAFTEATLSSEACHSKTLVPSHQQIQSRFVQLMHSLSNSDTSEQMSAAALAECCLRCFVSHYIALVCIELEQKFREQFGLRAGDVLPYVLSDADPLKSELDYEKNYQKKYHTNGNVSKDYKFQTPLAIHIVHTFDPNRGNLTSWTKRLTSQHRELNRVLAEYGIHRRTDWSILNSHSPARIKRLLAGILTDGEIQSMGVVLESYHAVYRQARRQTRQAGKPCKEPDPAQLAAMVCHLQQQNIDGYSPERVLQTLRFLASKLRYYKQPETSKDQNSLQQHQPHLSTEEREQELFLEYQQELLRECLDQAVKQVLDAHLNHLRQQNSPKGVQKMAKDRIFLEAMRLFYCEGQSMTEIAHQIGHQKEYQVSRILELKTLRERVRQPWHSLTCARIARLLASYVSSERFTQQQQQIEQLIALQIERLIAEDRSNAYRRNRATHTLLAESFRCYLQRSDLQRSISKSSSTPLKPKG